MKPSLEALPALMHGAGAATERVIRSLRGMADDELRAPSLLAGWTRAHVATHLARNAESYVRVLDGAATGTAAAQYPDGEAGRAADIETGAGRAAAEIVADVERTAALLSDAWRRFPAELWPEPVTTLIGVRPAWNLVWGRWREADIHHVDLDAGYGPERWPDELVALLLPEIVDGLERRLPAGTALRLAADDGWEADAGTGETVRVEGRRHDLLAWLLGRARYADHLRATGGALPPLASWL